VIGWLIKLLRSQFDPFFAVERTIGEKECAADAAGDAVMPGRHGDVDELGAGHRRGWILLSDRRRLPE
jgi:hypothetical protein